MDKFTKTYINIINNVKKKAIVKESCDSDCNFLVDSCGYDFNGATYTKNLASTENTWLEIYPGDDEDDLCWTISIGGDFDDIDQIYFNVDSAFNDLKSAVEFSINNAEQVKQEYATIDPAIIDAAVSELQDILGKMTPVEG